MRPYVLAGVVRVVDWPNEPPCQLQAYAHFLQTFAHESHWVAFIDCDEFLFSPSYDHIGDALARFPVPHCGAIAVNWLCFGSSGQQDQKQGLVTERFTVRPGNSFAGNRHIKSIVRVGSDVTVGPDPHHFFVANGTFSELGERVVGPFNSHANYELLRINHYTTKSREEYLQKISRGRPDVTGKNDASGFDGFQETDVIDQTIWKFLPTLKKRVGMLDLTQKIEGMLGSVPGWLTIEEAMLLFGLARDWPGEGVAVELGSYLGRSTICLALGLKMRSGSTNQLFAVDTHKGSAEHQPGQSAFNPLTWNSQVDGVDTFDSFLNNLAVFDVLDVVMPVRCATVQAAETFVKPIRLLFIDADHDPAAVAQDVFSWMRHLIPGSCLVMHDVGSWPGPTMVARELLRSGRFSEVAKVGSALALRYS